MNVVVLPDRLRLDIGGNLERLVERARASRVFAGTVDFDDAVWDLSAVKPARPSAKSKQSPKLYFTVHEARVVRGLEQRTPFSEPFASFVKAMIVLREESMPSALANLNMIVRAARALYDVMEAEGRDPVDLTSADFMAAANHLKSRKTQHGKRTARNALRNLGLGLVGIAEFVNRHSLSKVNISFSNPFRRIRDDNNNLTAEARKASNDKSATMEEMGAIIDVSLAVRARRSKADLLRTCAVELLCCAPVRINEVLDTRFDCKRTERARRKTTGEEVEYLGYAYDGQKGAPDSTKWIPSAMVPIADRALEDVRRITEPYREIARWMEHNPGRAYVAEPWRLADPETLMSGGEVSRALGVSDHAGFLWMRKNGVKKRVQGKLRCYRLGDIEKGILRKQAKVPPGKRLADYLFLVPRHFLREDLATQECVLTVVGDSQISDFLGNKEDVESIFERLKILDADNEPYRINTHSIRHLLNTLAQEGRLSQLDIARWSGRKDVSQNAVYDHSGGIALAEDLRKVLEAGGMEGGVVETASSLPPTDRDSFLKGRFATAHFTSIGACIQDFSLAPCPSHGACGGCAEHLVVKGKAEHKAEAERLLQEHQAMLDGARAEMADGTYNASAWVAHNERVVEGLKKTVAVHADPTIPDGTMVQV